MRNNKKGFTLIELVVVVLIMGILTSIGLPYYYKTIESSRAADAVSIGHLLSAAYRMYRVDHPSDTEVLYGQMTNDCNKATCSDTDYTACRLVACNYIAKQDWGSDDKPASYIFKVGDSGFSATARRYNGVGDYSFWGYNFEADGRCRRVPDNDEKGPPKCPAM